ncbi:hypothetical protein DOTSEDRAFT_47573 [Dothistroma septosporum NZE10]|uniref:Uncharacterized protein n=1 Tax=Dothistroma septosporum (strain NZE10 / CBS 128990) TaxID=675120 RepID=N1PCE5_DOTSN|nr:hypothetical protein DOTSEDRAFT_47573 [Dothistroma septosporum NZE10]
MSTLLARRCHLHSVGVQGSFAPRDMIPDRETLPLNHHRHMAKIFSSLDDTSKMYLMFQVRGAYAILVSIGL